MGEPTRVDSALNTEVVLTPGQQDERSRAETVAALDEAAADLEAGRYRDYTDATLSQLARELKAEGRAYRATKKRALDRPSSNDPT
jgi:hypothetical protein